MKRFQSHLNICVCLITFIFILSGGLLSCTPIKKTTAPTISPPYWWGNPHKDDMEFLFVKASAEEIGTEQNVREKAFENALGLLSRRIYAQVSVANDIVRLNSKMAIKGVRVANRCSCSRECSSKAVTSRVSRLCPSRNSFASCADRSR